MKEYKSDKNCLNILRLAVIIATFLLIVLCAYFLSFIPKLMILLNILFFAAGFFLVVIYLPVYFRNLRYYVIDNDKIVKESGFFFKKKQIISIDRIQYTTSVSTPFNKFTGLNFLVLYAYGGLMTIMFLNKNDFEELSFRFRK